MVLRVIIDILICLASVLPHQASFTVLEEKTIAIPLLILTLSSIYMIMFLS